MTFMILRRGERHSHAHKSSGKSGGVRLFLRQFENVRHSTEFWKRTGLHLPHQIGSMHLHRRFSDTHIVGHLFVESAGRGLDHDLALTGAKRVETFPEHSQRLFALSTGTIASQTSFDCIEKVLITERFREELYRPPFIACTVIGMSPCPVMKTIGSCLFAVASSLKLETA